MTRDAATPTIVSIAAWSLISLAAAMGIGRFAFTPLLPLMQHNDGVTLNQGAWLAAANYVGYLVGALASYIIVPAPSKAIRHGLLLVAVATAAMALSSDMQVWFGLRFLAGVASAFVLVGVSSKALGALSAAGRPELAGVVFAGVGVGVVFAGLTAMSIALGGWSTGTGWILLGCAALVAGVGGWRVWAEPAAAARLSAGIGASSLVKREWLLVIAYGGFGLGYIIPATFLPAMARSLMTDPMIFGWAWPIFGAAAAASTLIVTRGLAGAAPRDVFVGSMLVMAFGVAAPALSTSLVAIVISALCVGGTFMVSTMAGFQEAKRIAHGVPTRLIAAMTAAFALGQLAGPLLVSAWSGQANPVLIPSAFAVTVLLISAGLLRLSDARPIPITTHDGKTNT
jgi:MFS family permease